MPKALKIITIANTNEKKMLPIKKGNVFDLQLLTFFSLSR